MLGAADITDGFLAVPIELVATNNRADGLVIAKIAVPLNATSIRIAVKDVSTDRVGTMEVTLPLAPEARTQAASPVLVPVKPN